MADAAADDDDLPALPEAEEVVHVTSPTAVDKDDKEPHAAGRRGTPAPACWRRPITGANDLRVRVHKGLVSWSTCVLGNAGGHVLGVTQ